MKEKLVNLIINKSIMESNNIDSNLLQSCITNLSSVLNKNFLNVVPLEINSLPIMVYLMDLSEIFNKLKQCEGFQEHINNYTKNQVGSNYFVSLLASYLVQKVDKLILEPKINNKKTSDILIKFKEEKVYIECKIIDTKQFNFFKEHEHMSKILGSYIDSPNQVTITYKKSLSKEEIKKLGETLKERVPKVKGEGNIIYNEDIEVHAIKKDEYSDKRFIINLRGFMYSLHENCLYPNNIFMMGGRTISIVGPKVDFSKFLKRKISKGKQQYDSEKPFILAIDANNILGRLNENLKAISNLFQPEINTRFSGVLLVKSDVDLDLKKISISYEFIPNPYTKYPISQLVRTLFKESSLYD